MHAMADHKEEPHLMHLMSKSDHYNASANVFWCACTDKVPMLKEKQRKAKPAHTIHTHTWGRPPAALSASLPLLLSFKGPYTSATLLTTRHKWPTRCCRCPLP